MHLTNSIPWAINSEYRVSSGELPLRKISFFMVLAIIFLMISAQVEAQDVEPPDEPEIVADELNRGTPNGSAQGFLRVADLGDFEMAAEYLDLRNLRGEAVDLTGAQLARRMHVIVSRANWVSVEELVDDPKGRAGDGLPDYRDSIGSVLSNGKDIQLLMQRVPRGDGEFIWKISNATVSLVPALYETYGYPPVIEDLRRILPPGTFLGFESFKWVAALATGAFIYTLVYVLAFALRRAFGDRNNPSHRKIYRFLVMPFGVWSVVVAMISVSTALGRGITAETLARWDPVPTAITVWVMFAGLNLVRDIYGDYLQRQGTQSAYVLLRPLGSALKLLIFVGAILVYLDGLGVNITTVLAGLGIGGLAVALALQKPMEDVLGAITLYTQQPISVGDFCKIGDFTGTIDVIGLRTTFLRTLGHTRIAIPNARLATQPIENISARNKILYRTSLRLHYDAKPDQIRRVLAGITELLEQHERVLKDTCRVRFVEIAEDALKLEVYAHLDTVIWVEYLELVEELNLRLLDIVSDAGTSLSLPSRSLHIEREPEAAIS